MQKIELYVSGLKTKITIREAATIPFFLRYEEVDEPNEHDNKMKKEDILLPPVDLDRWLFETKRLDGNAAFAEYSLLIESFANAVLDYNRFLFHGAAFIWHGKAFIMTGKSGVGKTTQLRHWLSMYKEEIELINGDKPIIYCLDHFEKSQKAEFIVYPSPWTGKEGWNGRKSAKLGGIICLEQGEVNCIEKITKAEAVFPIFLQFLYIPDTAANVEKICRYEEILLNAVPVYKLINTGKQESAILTHDYLLQEGF